MGLNEYLDIAERPSAYMLSTKKLFEACMDESNLTGGFFDNQALSLGIDSKDKLTSRAKSAVKRAVRKLAPERPSLPVVLTA